MRIHTQRAEILTIGQRSYLFGFHLITSGTFGLSRRNKCDERSVRVARYDILINNRSSVSCYACVNFHTSLYSPCFSLFFSPARKIQANRIICSWRLKSENITSSKSLGIEEKFQWHKASDWKIPYPSSNPNSLVSKDDRGSRKWLGWSDTFSSHSIFPILFERYHLPPDSATRNIKRSNSNESPSDLRYYLSRLSRYFFFLLFFLFFFSFCYR